MFENVLEPKTDDEIVDSLIDDTMSNKINWDSDNNYIFCKIKINSDIDLIFRIYDISHEEEDDDDFDMYRLDGRYYDNRYDMSVRIINLSVSMKKKNISKETYIKNIKTSQMRLMYLLEYITPTLKNN